MECKGPIKEGVGGVDHGLVGLLALERRGPPVSARP